MELVGFVLFPLIVLVLDIQLACTQLLLFHSALSRTDGEYCCERLGLTLPVAESKEEITKLSEYVNSASYGKQGQWNVWLSLQHDQTNETANEHFFWIDNSTVTTSFWGKDEPKNLSIHHCVVLNVKYQTWYTMPCRGSFPVLCEKQDTNYTTVATNDVICPDFTMLKQSRDDAGTITFNTDTSQTDLTTRIPIQVVHTKNFEDCSAACTTFPLCKIAMFTSVGQWNCQLMEDSKLHNTTI